MAKSRTPKLLFNGEYADKRGTHYVKAWKEKRETIVQVWLSKSKPEGEPDGDWAMPAWLSSVDAAIAQAVLQTK